MGFKLEHVYKSYGNVQAVSDATLCVEGKHFVVLAGPSGCGKTSLLHIIAGFMKCDRGSIYIDKQMVNDVQPDQRGIAMVFQDAALFPHMSVYDNIGIGLEYSGLSKEESAKRIQDMSTVLGIQELLTRKAGALSNGQKQRVSIARALVRRPKLFLMDEPLSALDARLKSQLRIDIAALYQKLDATFLYVTHDQIEAMTLADTLILMKDGVFQQIGSPMEIYQNPCNLFTASFLGKYDINTFEGRIQDGQLCFEDRTLALQGTFVNQPITIAVRPEHILLDEIQGLYGNVVLVENLGDDIYYHIQWHEKAVLMKGNVHDDIHTGDEIRFNFHFDDAFCFDVKDEKRLYFK